MPSLPVESSVEGSVNATLDELIRGEPLVIAGEVLLPVAMALLARPGIDLGTIRRIITHPVAEAQCRRWVAAKLPDAQITVTTSTAAAAAAVAAAEADLDGLRCRHRRAGSRRTLRPRDAGRRDRRQPRRRHAFRRRDQAGPPPRPTGADRTSLVAFISDDHPGALLEILEQFATRGVNLTRIESRPTATAWAGTASRSTAKDTWPMPGSARPWWGFGGSAPMSGSSVRIPGRTAYRPPSIEGRRTATSPMPRRAARLRG